MREIAHALFGYANGHHLIASSTPLSSQSLKMLTPLTDSPGTGMNKLHDGYITGCPLFLDKFYALSKTWYATEMERPGCVWTHTLILTSDSLEGMTHDELDQLFIRPDTKKSNWSEMYSKPIRLNISNASNMLTNNDASIKDVANFMLASITQSQNPIIIFSTGIALFNKALEHLLCSWGVDFFYEFTFCTCSLTNRLIDKKELNLQIAPPSISKSYFRSSNSLKYIEESSILSPIDDCNIFNMTSKRKVEEMQNFMLSFGTKYYRFIYLEAFYSLYSLLTNLESNFEVKKALEVLNKSFASDEIPHISDKLLLKILNKSKSHEDGNTTIIREILHDLCTIDYFDYATHLVSNDTLTSSIHFLWKQDKAMLCSLLLDLTEQDINNYGELFISQISFLMDMEDVELILQQKAAICSILVQANWKLALCKDIWRNSASFQTDIIRSLAIVYNKCSDDEKCQFYSAFNVIFDLSVENIADCMYNEFGDYSIEMYFKWGETAYDDENVKRWAVICSKNQKLSMDKLSSSSNVCLFSNTIMQINPYALDIIYTESSIWERLYKQFCYNCNNQQLNFMYAQFVLPIVIKSNKRFPIGLVSFAYKTVHKILSMDAMDYWNWQKLSRLLPEVSWYNSWDKCKRLRKSAKQKQYDIFF